VGQCHCREEEVGNTYSVQCRIVGGGGCTHFLAYLSLSMSTDRRLLVTAPYLISRPRHGRALLLLAFPGAVLYRT
jgi:hypothetical protein